MSASIYQAGRSKNYLLGIYSEARALRKQVAKVTGEGIALVNNIDLEPRPANFRTASWIELYRGHRRRMRFLDER